jgi:hypothetical protein
MPDREGQGSVNRYRIETIEENDTLHYFTPQVLDVMLGNNLVVRFKRFSGWVTVWVDPIWAKNRRETFHLYSGHERRSNH